MSNEKNILIAFILNLMFSILEFFGGLITGSIAILSDSVHDLGDCISIGISYFLEKKSKKKADSKHTYGYIKYSVMGSIITTTILIIGSVFVIVEAVKRVIYPTPVNYDGMLLFAIFGVVINSLAAFITHDSNSLNEKSVNLHMLEDVLGWVVVLIGSILMKFTDIAVIDSIMSIFVAIFILINALNNMKKILDVFLEKTPDNINLEDLKDNLTKIKGVEDIHHIHIRSIDGYKNFITLHVVVDKYNKKIKDDVRKILKENNINHSTIELELKEEHCTSEKCDIKTHEEHHHHH